MLTIDGLKTVYHDKCDRDKDCDVKITKKKFANGSIHYVSQCFKCGNSFGQPISKSKITPTYDIVPFDEGLFNNYQEELLRPLLQSTQIVKKLRDIVKELKKSYYKEKFEIEYNDSRDFEKVYNKYLESAAWLSKRSEILKRDNYTCRYCASTKATQVHHLSYNNLGNEPDFELISVCKQCHQEIHCIDKNQVVYSYNKE
ncbi:MAG: hypothetical protein JWQ40_5060 [Segetibacter sp.]|jgi:hypothetical protein|nr:hypothetical protein [Segetibacter sp.]